MELELGSGGSRGHGQGGECNQETGTLKGAEGRGWRHGAIGVGRLHPSCAHGLGAPAGLLGPLPFPGTDSTWPCRRQADVRPGWTCVLGPRAAAGERQTVPGQAEASEDGRLPWTRAAWSWRPPGSPRRRDGGWAEAPPPSSPFEGPGVREACAPRTPGVPSARSRKIGADLHGRLCPSNTPFVLFTEPSLGSVLPLFLKLLR